MTRVQKGPSGEREKVPWTECLSPSLPDKGFPGGSDGKEYACNAGDPGSIPASGRFPGEGNGYPLRYSCLENPMEPDALQSTGSQRVKHD